MKAKRENRKIDYFAHDNGRPHDKTNTVREMLKVYINITKILGKECVVAIDRIIIHSRNNYFRSIYYIRTY